MTAFFRPLFDALTPDNLHTYPIEDQRQFSILASSISIGALFLVILGIITSLQGATLLSVFDFGIAATFVGLGIFLKETAKYKEISTILVSFLAIYFYFLFYYNGLERSTWVWYYTFPLWAMFLLGKKVGTTIALILIAITIATHLFILSATHEEIYSSNHMVRFVLSYLCVTTLGFAMETTRTSTYKKLLKTNSDLNSIIEELKDTKGQLHELTIRDSVTGLYNARHFHDILNLSITHANRYNGQIALSVIDVDYSNNYSSRYGNTALSQLVLKLSEIIKPIVFQDVDTLCKLDDSRFALIYNNIKAETVEQVSSKINKAIAERTIPHDRSPYKFASVSIGSVIIPEGSGSISSSTILSLAEASLERTAHKGKNCVAISLYKAQS